MASTYTWNGGSSRWNNGLNWTDATNPGAGTAPMAGDIATITAGTTTFDLVSGPGAAALLTTSGQVAFTGSLTLGTWDTTGYYTVLLESGALVNVGTAVLGGGLLLAGATLDVGSLSGGGLSLHSGASLRVSGGVAGTSVGLDSTSTAEFGTASLSTPGTLAIDPGVTASLLSITSAVLDDGVLLDTSSLSISGAVTGTGQITFGGTGTPYLYLQANVGAGIGIAFTGPSQDLEIGDSGTVTLSIAAPISGFAAGDTITDYSAAVTGAFYTATGTGVGTLALTGAGGAVVQSLTLLGDYTGQTFTFLPDVGFGGTVEIAAAATPSPTPAVSNPSTDAYRWTVGASGGFWDVAANWTDTTTGTTAAVAPGATNAAVLAGTAGFGATPVLVTGNGDASTLTVSGAIALNGAFTAANLQVGLSNTYEVASLMLLAGSTMATTNAGIYGSLDLRNAALSATGTLALGSNYSFAAATLTNGSRITAGQQLNDVFASISIDATSSIEVGTAGGGALGTLTVDSGALAYFAFDTIAAAIVNNGTVDLTSDYYRIKDEFTGPVTGTGLMQLGYTTYGDVKFDGPVASTQTIRYVSSESTIDISTGTGFAAAVTGLVSTDAFLVAPSVTGAAYASAGPNTGTLTLTDATGAVVQTLNVSGSIDGNTFVVLPRVSTSGFAPVITSTEVVLVNGLPQAGPPPAPAAGSATGQSFAWATDAGGAWNNPANWGSLVAPGSLDTVSLGTPSGYFQIISGSGQAAAATETTGTVLSGQFGFGTLTLNQNATDYGFVDVAAGATLSAGGITLNGGTLEAIGAGAVVAASGTLTLGDSTYFYADVNVLDGGAVQVANTSITSTGTLYANATITVDGTSRFEIGTAGGAAAGLLTVDAGAALTVATGRNSFVRVDATVLNNGTIGNAVNNVSTIYQSMQISGAVTGAGTLLVGSGGLNLMGTIAATQTIDFSGLGTLQLAAPTLATISGFAAGDSIVVAGTSTTASYVATGPNAGVLTLGGVGVAPTTFDLAGNYAGATFLAVPNTAVFLNGHLVPATAITLAAPLAPDPGAPPAIAGTRANQPVSDAATLAPFASVAITDPNAGQTETVTVTPSTTANGALTDPNAATDGGGIAAGVVTLSGTAAQVSTELDALVFTPTAHQVAPGGTVTTGFTIAATDTAGQTASDAATSVIATAAENPPVIGGISFIPEPIIPGQTLHPLSTVVIVDPDFGAMETATVTLTSAGIATDANGTLSGATETSPGTYVLAAGTPAAVQAELRALVFTQASSAGLATVDTGVTVQVSDGIAPPVSDSNTVIEALPNDTNPIPGDPNHFASTSTTSQTNTVTTPVAATNPTSSTTITAVLNGTQTVYSQTFALPYSDPTVQAAVAQANMDLANDGAVAGAPALTSSATTNQGSQTTTVTTGQSSSTAFTVASNYGPGTYAVGPSGADALTLFAGQVDQNSNTGTTTTVDQTATTTTTTLTAQTYTIADSTTPPVISGTVASQPVSDAATLDPFASVAITDPNAGQTETVTVTPSTTVNGVLTDPNAATDGGGIVAGVVTLSGTAAQVSAELDALVFTPTAHQVAPGSTETTGFTISDTDTAGGTATDSTTSVIATAAEDAPVIGGTSATPEVITSAQTVNPFAAATITDPDFGATETATIVLTSGGVATDATGTLSGATRTGVGTYVLAAASPSAEQAALRAVVFTPAINTGASPVDTGLTLQVADGIAPPVSDSKTLVAAYTNPIPVQGAPNEFTSTSSTAESTTVTTPVARTVTDNSTTITAVLNGTQTVYSQTFALPYSDPTVQAAIAQADMALASDGAAAGSPTLTSSGTTTQGTQTTTVTTGTTTGAPTLRFTTLFGPGTIMVGPQDSIPFTLAAGQIDFNTNTDTLTTVAQTATTTTTQLATQSYAIAGSTTAPVISGTVANQPVSDAATLAPFASVAITDANINQFETVTITPGSAANGVLSDPNAATDGSIATGGGLAVSGTAAQVNAAIGALVFTPTAHQVAPGGTVTTGFTIADTDTLGQSASDSTTSVIATAAEDAPVITGTYTTPVVVNASQTVRPFGAAAITDPDLGATETATITLNANGAPTDADGTLTGAGLTETAAGIYQLAAASPAAETAALQALVFTPAANTGSSLVSTGLTLQVSDGIAPSVTDANTVVQSASGSSVTTTSSTSETVTDTTPVTQTIADSSTTITAVLNGDQTVYDQTFALPFSDPAVQAAVAQADMDLAQAGAAAGAPILTSSQVINQGSQTTTAQTGTRTGAATVTQAITYGPATVLYGPSHSLMLQLASGQEDINTNTDTVTTIDQTATTTTTQLTTQAYMIAGSTPVSSGATPFANIMVGSTVAGDMVTVTLGLSPATVGTFGAGFGGTANQAGTLYSFTGTVPATNALLQSLTFTPAAGSPAQIGVQASVTSTSGSASLTDTGTSHDTLAATGNDTLTTDGAGSTLVLGPDNATAILDGNDSVTGGAGLDRISTSTGNVLVTPGTGMLAFANGSGTSTVLSAAGSVTVTGGTGGGLFLGGLAGGNQITAGQQSTTIYGGGGGDQMFLAGTGGDLAIGGSGTETVYGNGSAGNDTIYTGAFDGSGNGVAVLGSGNDMVFARGSDTILAGAGSDTVGAVGSANVLVIGGPGKLNFSASGAGNSTVGGGAGSDTIYGASGGGVFYGGAGGNNVLIAGQAPTTLYGGGAGDTLFTEGAAGDLAVAGGGAETIYGGGSSGNDTIYTGAFDGSGNSVAVLGSGNDVVYARGSDTIAAGGGSDTINAVGAANVFAFGTGGKLTFLNGTGTAMVGDGPGSDTLYGGQGGGEFFGGFGGNNVLVAGAGASTLVGGGSGDVLTATGTAGDVLIAGSGNETLNGAQSGGADAFFAKAGTDQIVGGYGADRFFGGSGAATVTAGTGADIFGFVNGSAGGSVTVLNFNAAIDQVYLQGYAPGAGAAAVSAALTVNGSTTLVLPDQSRITFVGVSSPAGLTITG